MASKIYRKQNAAIETHGVVQVTNSANLGECSQQVINGDFSNAQATARRHLNPNAATRSWIQQGSSRFSRI